MEERRKVAERGGLAVGDGWGEGGGGGEVGVFFFFQAEDGIRDSDM